MSALVLLAEDEDPIQILLSYNLEAEGYKPKARNIPSSRRSHGARI